MSWGSIKKGQLHAFVCRQRGQALLGREDIWRVHRAACDSGVVLPDARRRRDVEAKCWTLLEDRCLGKTRPQTGTPRSGIHPMRDA